jgi:uncharacterized phage protein (TIGR01671 family)
MNDRFRFRIWNPDLQSYDDNRDYNVAILVNQDFGLVLQPYRDNIIEMCTGLKDKNGNLIYEGDVVLFNDDDYPWQIKWNEVFVRWVLYSPLCSNEDGEEELTNTDAEYLEIIGNIHEQAEQKDK